MSIITTIESDLSAAGQWLEAEAETIASDAWGVVKTVFVKLAPAEFKIISDAVGAAVVKLESGATLEEIETAALNTLIGEELDWAKTLGSDLIQGIAALFRAKAKAA